MAARWLLAAVFALATLWKLSNVAFVDGSFFEFTLLTDSRFAPVATVIGGVDTHDLDANRTVFDAMDGAGPGASVDLLGLTARLALAGGRADVVDPGHRGRRGPRLRLPGGAAGWVATATTC